MGRGFTPRMILAGTVSAFGVDLARWPSPMTPGRQQFSRECGSVVFGMMGQMDPMVPRLG
jgi:hypothetical protein